MIITALPCQVVDITAGVYGFREVQQQLSAVQEAQAQLWAERSQLAVEQQAVAEDKARAVQDAQEAATAHASLLLHFKQARAQSVLVAPLPLVAHRCRAD